MGFGRNTGFERHFDSTEHRLLVMLQHKREDLDHLPVAALSPEQYGLQVAERLGHLDERRPIAQGTGFALVDRQIMTLVIDSLSRQMRPLDDPCMLAQDLAFCGDNDLLRIDAQADRTVGERGRYAVSVALKVNQAGR